MSESTSTPRPASPPEEADLADALDSFAEWVRGQGDPDAAGGLPPLQVNEALAPGSVLGDYELVRRLGMGGMGVVFEARQRHVLGRRVALKVLRNAFETEDLSRRFRREVAAVAELDHPAIVPVVDARVELGTPFYVMKFVPGVSASALVRELRSRARAPADCVAVRRFVEKSAGGSSDPGLAAGPESTWEESYPRWVASLGLQIAEALHYAHEHGFVHRDVKPGNVLVTPEGRGVLVDFGLVAALGQSDEGLTRSGEFLGTLAYASPEQVRGEAPDARSDVYSLGATLYELLALARPFGSCGHTELVRRIERDDPVPLGPELPRDLRTIVGHAMARVPGQRYQSAGAMAADLRAFLARRPIRARPPGWIQQAVAVVRRHPRIAAALLGVALTVGGFRALAHRRASELVARSQESLEQALVARTELDRLQDELVGAARQRPRDHQLWLDLRRRVSAARTSAEDRLVDARELAEQSFEHVAGYGPGRAALARIEAEALLQALRDARDVLEPGSLAALEGRLTRHDEERRFASLTDPRGWVSLTSRPRGARVMLEGQPGEWLTPIRRLELPEGSYVARLEADGRAPAVLPFLVRRVAADGAGASQPGRRLTVELLPRNEVPSGFVYVPGGETLIEDDPPRWERVGSFLCAGHETTVAEVVAWANAHEDRLATRMSRPVMATLPVRRDASGRWAPEEGIDPRLPVLGETPLDMFVWTSWLEDAVQGAPSGWGPSLPTRAEWMRAARGADGRPYPWGWSFEGERCVSYLSGGSYGADADPLPVGAVPGDVSPFGIHDLAGSAAELSLDLHEPRPGEFTACGGSYWCSDPVEFQVTHTREDENDRPRKDVGFRVVLRPLPPEPIPGAELAGGFRDDFERPDSEDVGNGWLEFASSPLGTLMTPHALEQCSLVDGRLVCLGGRGSFSDASCAWHPIHPSPEGCTVRAVIRAEHSEADVSRSFGLGLGSALRSARGEHASLTLGFAGEAGLSFTTPSGTLATSEESGLDPGAPLLFELSVGPDRVRGRISTEGADAAEGIEMELLLESPTHPFQYVGISVPNLVGARVLVDWLEVGVP